MTKYQISTHTERPELMAPARALYDTWPVIALNDEAANLYWPLLDERFPDFQFHICDGETIVAEGNGLSVVWNGRPESLPDGGFNTMMRQGMSNFENDVKGTTFCGVSVTINEKYQGKGVSKLAVQTMKDLAKKQGLDTVIVPVRPSQKSMYPLTAMENYIQWRREDGLLFDAWLRVHERLGATIAKVAPESMRVSGTVADFENWTQMKFPESGEYVVKGALNPISIDIEKDEGLYVEPNVWMVHSIG
jgi:RimJ/RimL family protein N-acetyltransferase